jgi:AcrR family transcriptional regulator
MVVRMSRQQAVKLGPGAQRLPREEVGRIQRQRLLDAMAEVVAAVGYEETTVERVLTQAGVSRRTFYELFSDREDCFLAAYEAAMRDVFALVADAYLDCEQPERRIEAALEAFLRFCAANPSVARMCVVEVFAAGARARERRSELMERFAALLEHALGELRGDERLDRLAARALVGGVHEVIYGPIDAGAVAQLPALAREIVSSQIAPLAEVRG